MQVVHRHSWPLQMKDAEALDLSHSEPWNKPQLSNHKPSLKPIRTLEECVQLIKELEKEVEALEKHGRRRRKIGPDKGVQGNPKTQSGLESSRKLILKWAEELDSLHLSSKHSRQTEVKETANHVEKNSERMLEWARELQNVSESYGLSDTELKQILAPQAMGKKRLASVLPLLEFVAWSLLTRDPEEDVARAWLSVKQRVWKAGTPRYIPNSVWQWIQSASVRVDLDPNTSHPWLLLTEENQQLQEADQEGTLPDHPQRFDSWTCVLGWEGFSTGRHYWEVEATAAGGWRLGVTAVSAPRKGRFHMCPAQGYWALWRGSSSLWACTDPETKLPHALLPRVVGIYLDYQEGQVSFYNAEDKCHIYTFSDTFQEKLYPLFCSLDGDTKLRVTTPDTPPVMDNARVEISAL